MEEGQQEEMALLAPPTLTAPAEGELTTAISDPPLGVPSLRWEPVAGAVKYEVQVSKSMGFATTLVAQVTFATSHTPAIALEDGIHYWRVKAFDGKLWGPYSEIRSFDKDWSTGGTLFPQLLAPADGSQITAFSHHHFSWQPVQGAATYLLEISPDVTFSDNVYSDTTIKPHHTPSERLGNNRYYWRVTPIDSLDHHGLPSEVWSFTFSWDVAPQPLSPADNIDTPFLPRFSWTAVEAANIYQLEISTQDDFGSANIYTTPNTQFTPEDTLSNDQDYYWRVKAIDYQGTSSEWSPVQSFRTRWNFQTRLLTPLNNGIQRSYPFFSWTPIPGVDTIPDSDRQEPIIRRSHCR